MSKPWVIVLSGSDRRDLIRQAQLQLGVVYTNLIKSAKLIFVHPNLVTDRNRNAVTDLEAVRAILDVISLQTDKKVLIGDGSYHDTKKAFRNFDYQSLERSGNIQLLDLNDDETIQSFAYDRNFHKKPIPFSKTVAEADLNIVVVRAKMHSYYTLTLALKTHIVGSQVVKPSPFGIHARWPWLHTGFRQAHQTLAEVYLEHPAQAAFIDGTETMEGNGPAGGEMVRTNWLVGSLDPVAADSVAAYLMGFDPSKEVGYLSILKERGRAVDLDQIEISGDDPESLRRELKRPSTWPEIAGWRLAS